MSAERGPDKHGFIPTHGGYEKLLSYQKSLIVYQGTLFFAHKWFSKYDRTIDQCGLLPPEEAN